MCFKPVNLMLQSDFNMVSPFKSVHVKLIDVLFRQSIDSFLLQLSKKMCSTLVGMLFKFSQHN
jgi:hypothetical protein